jgi:hypothetical protein
MVREEARKDMKYHEEEPEGFVRTAAALLGVVAVRYAAFYERFGRHPEIHEPLLFDPSADTPIPAEQDNQVLQILSAAQLSEVDPSAVLDWLGLGDADDDFQFISER